MNYFTKKKLITLAITALIIVNITSLSTVWFQQHGPIRPPKHKLPKDSREATTFFLKEELQFSDEQVEKFMSMQKEFLDKNHQIQQQIGENKKDLFSGLIDNKSINENEIIIKIGELSRQREEITFKYFSNIKNLCSAQQQKKYKMLIGEILMRIDPNHMRPKGRRNPPPMNPTGQKPPPRKDQRPLHNPR